MIEQGKHPYRWFMLFWLMTVCLVIGLATAIMPALFDEIKRDLDFSHSQLGVIWGFVAFGILLTAFIGGTMGDRYGIKKVIGAGLIIGSISCIIRALWPDFWGLSIGMFFIGVASGLIFPNIPKVVGMWFGSKELGKALGLIQVEGTAGWAIALMVGAHLSSLLGGWDNVMWLMGVLSFAGTAVWFLMARERPYPVAAKTEPERLSTIEGMKKVMRWRDLWLIAIIELLVGGAAISNVGLLPETLEARGLTSSMAGMYTSISTWTIALFAFAGAYFSDRVGLRKIFMWPFLLASSGCITFFGVFLGAPVIITIVIYSATLGPALPLFRALVIETDQIDSSLTGTAVGIIYTINRIGAIVLPIAMGFMIDVTGEYWPAFLLLAGLLAGGAFVAMMVTETGFRAKKAASAVT